MACLKDVMVYLLKNHPAAEDLSKARLTKLVYLADWKSAIKRSSQITSVNWYFDNFGPYVKDVQSLARLDKDFKIVDTVNERGNSKQIITLQNHSASYNLSDEDREILDFVIKATATKNWSAFIQLVYSTYPIRSQPRFSDLDLVTLANDYVREQYELKNLQPTC